MRVEKRAIELAMGRLVMVAIFGMLSQDGSAGPAWSGQAMCAGDPLGAFEGELGVRPPFDFWIRRATPQMVAQRLSGAGAGRNSSSMLGCR